MQYPTLDRRSAEALLAQPVSEPSWRDKLLWRGSGDKFDLALLDDLILKLISVTELFSEEERSSGWGQRFDAMGAEVIHSWARSNKLPVTTIVDQGFWRAVAVGKAKEIIEFRYGTSSTPAGVGNYGITGTRENALFRLYQIGSIVYSPESDQPYSLASVGDVDFWRSHILRQNYGNVKPIALALITIQADLIPDSGKLNNKAIRLLAKDLRRLRANIVYEVLDNEEALMLVVERAALARTGYLGKSEDSKGERGTTVSANGSKDPKSARTLRQKLFERGRR